jgi:hypothetical protein
VYRFKVTKPGAFCGALSSRLRLCLVPKRGGEFLLSHLSRVRLRSLVPRYEGPGVPGGEVEFY